VASFQEPALSGDPRTREACGDVTQVESGCRIQPPKKAGEFTISVLAGKK